MLGDPRALGLMLGLSGAGAMVGAAYGVLGASAGIYLAVCLHPFVGKVWRGLDTRICLSVQPNQ